ncbi:lipopolysaccharide biosynthesis protein [Dyadobacter arcticus]|uniref:O-antigen/teichoic acid export membrane protein n=1 Tax=Dyadobacter arcticus TaxID=1078754 RepID=A0ABX0UJ31_9BACT|nr:oligosaccharide flippase family protein [Dyadobacter arcticus]NIJ51570.1 O-antigen/teichoic acid export membrane protein [Dyadobacter arcticus]
MSVENRIINLGRASKSLSISFVSQITTSAVSFIVVPLLIQYLSREKYGLWVTLVSLVSWILMSDFGIGYGFRNKVTEYLADKDLVKLNRHFKNTFQYYLIITFLVTLFFLYVLANNPILSKHKSLSLIIYLPYIIYFPFSISNQILQGLRLVHYTALIGLLRALLWFCFIAIIIHFEGSSNLINIAIGYSLINSIVNGIAVYLAITKSDITVPNFKSLFTPPVIDKTLVTGIKFFVLQISSLLMFSMGNYYVYSNLTPSDTAYYDTINKVYTLYMTFFNMIISVFWSEIVFQKTSGDFAKLRTTYKRLLAISLIVSLGSFAIMFIAPFFISFWTNNKILINKKDCLPFSFLVSVQSLAYSGAVFLNAFEKVMPQVILAIVSIILIYPLIQLGFKHNTGIGTVPLVSGILALPALIICHVFALRLIRYNAQYDIHSEFSSGG